MKVEAPVKDGKRVGGIPPNFSNIPQIQTPSTEFVDPNTSKGMDIDRARQIENERARQGNRPDRPSDTAMKVLILENDIQKVKEKLDEKENEIEILKAKNDNIEKYLKEKDKDFKTEAIK